MTDAELEELTAPTEYSTVAPVQLDGGLFVADVERPVRRDRCGYCANNGTGLSNPECNRPIHRRGV